MRELTGGAGVGVGFEVLGRQQTFEAAVGIATGASTANLEITP